MGSRLGDRYCKANAHRHGTASERCLTSGARAEGTYQHMGKADLTSLNSWNRWPKLMHELVRLGVLEGINAWRLVQERYCMYVDLLLYYHSLLCLCLYCASIPVYAAVVEL